MARKLLFVVFTNDPCKRNHAFMQALDLTDHGHQVRLLLEGEGTRCLTEREGRFGDLFTAARGRGLLVGACKTASAGACAAGAGPSLTAIATDLGLPLLDAMTGHASIVPFIEEGFELVVF